jgi:hypothetical protein
MGSLDMDECHTTSLDNLPNRIADSICSSLSVLDKEKGEWTQALLCDISDPVDIAELFISDFSLY